jgi:hypothetical protein
VIFAAIPLPAAVGVLGIAPFGRGAALAAAIEQADAAMYEGKRGAAARG